MTTLRELADDVAALEAAVERPSILSMFDSVFRPEPLDPRKVTMESVLDAMRPTVIPKENE